MIVAGADDPVPAGRLLDLRGEAGLQRAFVFVTLYVRVVEVVLDEAAAHLRRGNELLSVLRAALVLVFPEILSFKQLVAAVEEEFSLFLEHEHVDGTMPPVALRPELRVEEVERDLVSLRFQNLRGVPRSFDERLQRHPVHAALDLPGRHLRIGAGIDAGADDVVHAVHLQQIRDVAHLGRANHVVIRDLRVVEPVGDEAPPHLRGLHELPGVVRVVQVLVVPEVFSFVRLVAAVKDNRPVGQHDVDVDRAVAPRRLPERRVGEFVQRSLTGRGLIHNRLPRILDEMLERRPVLDMGRIVGRGRQRQSAQRERVNRNRDPGQSKHRNPPPFSPPNFRRGRAGRKCTTAGPAQPRAGRRAPAAAPTQLPTRRRITVSCD